MFTDGQTYAATQVLKTVIQSGTGPLANYGCPAAGKTGTAENLANAWFVGYNPHIATAVWVGYPQGNISLGPNGFGGTLAAPIWHDFMQRASDGYCGDFPTPSNPFSARRSSARTPPPARRPWAGTGTGATGDRTGEGNHAKNNRTATAPCSPAAPAQDGRNGNGNGGGTGNGTRRPAMARTGGGGGATTGGTGGAGVPGH